MLLRCYAQRLRTEPGDDGLWKEGERNSGRQNDEKNDVARDKLRYGSEGLCDVGKGDS